MEFIQFNSQLQGDCYAVWTPGSIARIAWNVNTTNFPHSSTAWVLRVQPIDRGYNNGLPTKLHPQEFLRASNDSSTALKITGKSDYWKDPELEYTWLVPQTLGFSETLYRLHISAKNSTVESSRMSDIIIIRYPQANAARDSGTQPNGQYFSQNAIVGLVVLNVIFLAALLFTFFVTTDNMLRAPRRTLEHKSSKISPNKGANQQLVRWFI